MSQSTTTTALPSQQQPQLHDADVSLRHAAAAGDDAVAASADTVQSDVWSNPTDHFRPNMKLLTVYFDHNYVRERWLRAKERWLRPWYVPWWSPLYQIMTWYEQRNRNLALVENHLNYRPYRYRRNDEDPANPY